MKNVTKVKSFDYDLIASAHHESGHTIMCLHNYMYVVEVSVVINGSPAQGNTSYITLDPIEFDDQDLNQIVHLYDVETAYAGLIAEKMYYKDICGSDKFPMHLKEGSSLDIREASSIIRKNNFAAPGKDTYNFKKKIQDNVKDVLTEHWDAVKIIAHSLYQKRRLSFDEIKNLLIKKTDHKDFWKDRFKKIKILHSDRKLPSYDDIKSILSRI